MSNQKTGLILCYNIEISKDLPSDVIWDHVKDFSTITSKYDYVVDQNCNKETVDLFLSKPSLYLKSGGQFIHLNGVTDVLRTLQLDLNSYLRKDKTTIELLSNHIKRLTKDYGFEKWFIPAVNNMLTTNIYYTLGLQPLLETEKQPERNIVPLVPSQPLERQPIPVSEKQLERNIVPLVPSQPIERLPIQRSQPIQRSLPRRGILPKRNAPPPPSPSLIDTLSDDEIYAIVQQMDVNDLGNLCASNKRMNNLCNTARFLQIIEEHLYGLIEREDYISIMKICKVAKICQTEKFKTFALNNLKKLYSTPKAAWNMAINYGNPSFVKYLLLLGITPTNFDLITASMRSYGSNLDIIKLLLQYPTIDASTNNNQALLTAVQNHNVELVDLLLTHGNGTFKSKPLDANLLKTDTYPLMLAIAHARDMKPIVQRLLADPIVGTFIPPLLPAYKDEILKYDSPYKRNLINDWIKQYPTADQALIAAIQSNSPDIIRLLMLDPRIDTSANNNAALDEAIIVGNTDIIDLLLTHGHGNNEFKSKPLSIEVLKTNPQPLYLALTLRKPLIIRRLLDDSIIGTFIPPLLPEFKDEILKYNSLYKQKLIGNQPR